MFALHKVKKRYINFTYNIITIIEKLKLQMDTSGYDMLTSSGIVLLRKIRSQLEKKYEVTVSSH